MGGQHVENRGSGRPLGLTDRVSSFRPRDARRELHERGAARRRAEDDLGDPPARGEAPKAAPRAIPGSFATIHFKNELGKTLSLVEARLTLDGDHLPAVEALGPDGDTVVFAGRVTPGHHLLGAHPRLSRQPTRPLHVHEGVHVGGLPPTPCSRSPTIRPSCSRSRRHAARDQTSPFDKQVAIVVRDHVIPPPVSAR